MSETEVTTEDQVVDTDDLDTFSSDFFGQKTDKSEKTTSEVEQEPEDDGEVGNTDAQKTNVDPNDDPDAEFKEAPPKKKTVQDRIDEIVKQREDAKRDGEAKLEALRKEFEEKLAALQPKQTKAENSEPTPDDTKEDGSPKYELGEFDPQYIRDLTRYTLQQERNQAAEQAEVERKANENDQARQTLQVGWNTKVEAATTTYPDFVEKGQKMLANFNNLDQGYAEYLSTTLMSMEKGPEVLYYLSDHPEEAIQIVNSGAQKATITLGRIEARFIEDGNKEVAKTKMTKAPPPPPVRARGTNGAFVSVAPDTDDLDAFSQSFFTKR